MHCREEHMSVLGYYPLHRELAARSEGLKSRVDAAVELQQAANQVLVRLLGARYTLGGILTPVKACMPWSFLESVVLHPPV